MAKQAYRLPEIAGWKLIYFWSLEITRHKSESFSWPELWTFPEYKSKDSTWKIKLPTLFGRWYWQEQLVPCHCHYKHFHSKYSINCFIVPTILIHSFPIMKKYVTGVKRYKWQYNTVSRSACDFLGGNDWASWTIESLLLPAVGCPSPKISLALQNVLLGDCCFAKPFDSVALLWNRMVPLLLSLSPYFFPLVVENVGLSQLFVGNPTRPNKWHTITIISYST